MSQITMELSDEAILALGKSPTEAGAELRLAAAAKLVQLGRVSTGAAAEIAGLPRTVFLGKLGAYGVDTFDLSAEELAREYRFA